MTPPFHAEIKWRIVWACDLPLILQCISSQKMYVDITRRERVSLLTKNAKDFFPLVESGLPIKLLTN